MGEEVKRMPVKEFRQRGLLQEINRRILHPLGLAIEILRDEDGTERLGGIWDFRDDPEGIVFAPSTEEGATTDDFRARAVHVALEWERRRDARKAALGYMVQPLGENVDGPLT